MSFGDDTLDPSNIPQINQEKLAEIVSDAFGPAFVALATQAGRFEPKATAYERLPEQAKQMFRDVAVVLIRRHREWLK